MNISAIIKSIIQLGICVVPFTVAFAIFVRGRESYEDSYAHSRFRASGISLAKYKLIFRLVGLLLLIISCVFFYYIYLHETPQDDDTKEFMQLMEKNKNKEIFRSALLLGAIAIPTRMSSTRFPGKPLAKLGGKAVLQHVYEKCKQSAFAKEIFILTDSPEIEDFAGSMGAKCLMTSPDCQNGTERIIEALPQIDSNFIVNVQGDEPFISPALIDSIFRLHEKTSCEIATAASLITDAQELPNPNCVKVLSDASGKIIYFSRLPLPYVRGENDYANWLIKRKYLKHIGIYGYTKDALLKYSTLPKSSLEICESLEQLRFIDAGIAMELVETDYKVVGIDTPEDLLYAEKLLESKS